MKMKNNVAIATKNVIAKADAVRVGIIVCMSMIYCKMMILGVDAAPGSELGEKLKGTLNAAYAEIVVVIGAIYGFALVIGALRIYISSGREVDGIWAYIKRCTAAFLIIILAATIVKFVQGMVGDGGTTLV